MHIQTNVIFNFNHICLVPYIAINKNELCHPQNKQQNVLMLFQFYIWNNKALKE